MRGRHLLLTSAVLFLLTSASAQKRSVEIGVKIINELTFANGYAPGAGIPIVYRFGKHGGIESGCYYKIRPSHPFLISDYGALLKETLTERTLIIPLLYRYDSKFINFSVGAAVEFLIGWRMSTTDYYSITTYTSRNPELISTASISKTFPLSSSLVFEPEIRFSAFVPNGDGSWGLNLSVRKKIF